MSTKLKREIDKRPKKRRLGVVVSTVAVLVGLVIVGLAVLFLQGPSSAPEWAKDRVKKAVVQAMPGAEVDFHDLQWTLGTEGRPIVFMQNAVFLSENDIPVLEISELQLALSLKGLLVGNVLPKELSVSGVFLNAERMENGEFAVSLSNESDFALTRDALAQGLEHPLLSELENVSIEAITLGYEDRRAGRAWTVDGGRLRLSIDDDLVEFSGDLALLGGGASVATLEANATVSRSGSGVQFGVKFSDLPAVDLATQQASLFWLSVVDAPISGSLRGGLDDRGEALPVAAVLKIGEGRIKPSDQAKGIPFASAESYLSYDPEAQTIQFDQIAVNSDWLTASAEGEAKLVIQENGLPSEINTTLSFASLESSESGPWHQAMQFEDAQVDFDLQVDPFHLKLGGAGLSYKGAAFNSWGNVTNDADGWVVDISAAIPKVTHAELMDLWPIKAGAKTRRWLAENVREADYGDLAISYGSTIQTPSQIALTANIANGHFTYAKNMSPAQQVNGTLALTGPRFEAFADTGFIYAGSTKAIDASGTRFVVDDVTNPDAMAHVTIDGSGELQAVLPLLEQLPGLSDDGTDISKLAEGQSSFQGDLSFPIGRKPLPNDFIYSFTGLVDDASSSELISGHEVTAKVLQVTADNSGVVIQGPAEIDGVGLNAIWNSVPGKNGEGYSALTGQIELSQDFVEQFGLGLPEGTVIGQGTGNLFLDMPKGESPSFDIVSNLEGVGFDLGFVGWTKSEKTKGDLHASGTLGQPVSVDLLEITAPGLEALGRVSMNEDGSLQAVEFEKLRLGSWLNSSVRIQGNGAGQPSDLHLTGGFVDIQSLTEATGGIGGETGKQVQGQVFANDLELYVSDFLSLRDFNGAFDLGRNLHGQFTGVLNDAVEIGGAISSDASGQRVITATAEDAGAVLSALGLLEQAAQGSIIAELTEKSDGYGGRFTAKDVRLLNMPLLADLLNAVSIVGLLDQLSFDGIGFSEVEGEFYFTENEFILTRASATGPSIGLSLDGTYDFENDMLDLQGVLTPVYLVNGIGELFTRKGEGVIGFNFNVTGKSDDPDISINPLSALTPSFFRELFRKPAPKAPE